MSDPKPKMLVLDPGDALGASCRAGLDGDFELDYLGVCRDLLPTLEKGVPHALLVRVDASRFSLLAHYLRQVTAFDRELPIVLILAPDLSADQRGHLLAESVLGHADDGVSGPELRAILRRALKLSRMLVERRYLRERFEEEVALELLGQQSELEDEIRAAAGSDEGLVIVGEPGSGRSSVARMIHRLSKRAPGAFVSFNPTSYSADECRWRLFGDGGIQGPWRHGLLETADAGTLLIEEMDSLPTEVRDELGQALVGSQLRSKGNEAFLPARPRIIGTSRPSRSSVAPARRLGLGPLKVRRLTLPALGDRQAEIFALLQRAADRYARKLGLDPLEIDAGARRLIRKHSWPGGMAEIQRVAELAVLRARGKTLTTKDFWIHGLDLETLPADYKQAKRQVENHFKRSFFERLLTGAAGRVTVAATRCGLSRPTVSTILKELGLRAADFKPARRSKAAGSS